VTGTVYMDHTHQFGNPGKLLQSGYRFVQHTSEKNWELTYFLNPQISDRHDLIGYQLSNDEGKVSANTVKVEEDLIDYNSTNKEFPKEFHIYLEDGRKIKFFHQNEIDRRSVFDDLNWIARNLARRLVGGEYYDHRGIGKMQIHGSPARSGHFNYFIVH